MTSLSENTPEQVRDYIRLWAESMGTVLGQIAAASFPVQNTAERQPGTPAAHDVQLIATAAGAARGELSLRIPESSALALAKLFTGAVPAGSEITAEESSAIEELLRQVAGHIVTSAGPLFPDLSLSVALRESPTWSPAASGWFESGPGAPCEVALEWQMSAALHTSLSQLRAVPRASGERGSEKPASNGAIDLFMDLQLDVALRFGGRNVLLKDVLELGPGSVLELDREIHDDADLLLDGKLIAHGEVVVVNGNFGLRVTQVFLATQS
jgi:flagellar motor switch protein FliN